MNDSNSLEGLRLTEQAPEAVWRRLNVAEVGLGKLAEQAAALGFQGVEVPRFVDPYAEVAAPVSEVPELDDNDLRRTIKREASSRDQFAGRYGSNGVSEGQSNA